MKLQFYHLENDLDFSEAHSYVLQIESKDFFTRLLNSFHKIEKGEEPEERIFFYNNEGEEIDLYNKIRVVIDYLNFDLNGKKELNPMYKRLNEFFNEKPEIYTNFSKDIEKIISDLKEIFWEEDIIFECVDQYDFTEFLKFIKLKYKVDDYNILEKLMLLIDLESIFKFNELLVFVQLSSYLQNEELIKLFDYASYKKVNILLLDTSLNGPTLKNEVKLIIDNEYDEFLLKNG